MIEKGGFRIQNLGGGLWTKDGQSRFEDTIMPHQHLIYKFIFILSRESRYFKDIVKLLIFRLRMICNFFQVCTIVTTKSTNIPANRLSNKDCIPQYDGSNSLMEGETTEISSKFFKC